MIALAPPQFNDTQIGSRLEALTAEQLDDLDFGVIGFDGDTVVRVYNRFESAAAGLRPQSVLGRPLFTEVAPCMNNFMVAQRFEDAAADPGADTAAATTGLDATIDYVLTLRMRPEKVALRLVADPSLKHRYVLVRRRS